METQDSACGREAKLESLKDSMSGSIERAFFNRRGITPGVGPGVVNWSTLVHTSEGRPMNVEVHLDGQFQFLSNIDTLCMRPPVLLRVTKHVTKHASARLT